MHVSPRDHLIENFGTDLSIVLRVVALAIFVLFVMRVQLSSFNRNKSLSRGLKLLGFDFLMFWMILVVSDIFSLAFLLEYIDEPPLEVASQWLQLINAVAFLGLSIYGYRIYNREYDIEDSNK